MKAYSGSGGTAPLILNIGTRWMRVVNLTSRSGRSMSRYAFQRRLSGPHRGLDDLIENISCLCPTSKPASRNQ